MSDKKKLIDGNEVKEITPEIIAELFAELGSDEQARFFNRVAEVSSRWGGGGLAMQLQWITDDNGLTLAGRRVMQHIGEYSHWGLVPRAERKR